MSFLVVVLAVVLRVAWVLVVPSKPVGDFAMYIESAAHLVEHGAFDPEYVYMPGYIFLLAPVQALGGGWLACKLVGAILGGLGAGAVVGIARRLSGGSSRVAWIAGLLYALWPAGIAVSSVTGTDMPAAVLVTFAAYFLLRHAGARPIVAALLFGLFTGLAAYIRAIVVPLAALSVLVFRAQGLTWRKSLGPTALSCAIALLVLSPWAIRNRLRYGETFFTDSHGGLTALVGANPNTDGCYSRSLNRQFRDVTGFPLLAEPHREADRASLAIARTWTSFDPLFSLGLVIAKAERLLTRERALLYWPLFRAGVLPEPQRSFFAKHRSLLEDIADGFWLGVVALSLMGCGLALARGQWLWLVLLPQAIVLGGLYAAIFSEQRYRLPIEILLLPLAALALDWIARGMGQLARRHAPTGFRRELVWSAGLATLVLAIAPAIAWAGEQLRERHRWAATECTVAGQVRFCAWRTRAVAGNLEGRPGVKGVWNGVGVAMPLPAGNVRGLVSAETEIDLASGDYDMEAALDIGPSPAGEEKAAGEVNGEIRLRGEGDVQEHGLTVEALVHATREGHPHAWHANIHHGGGRMRLRLEVEIHDAPAGAPLGRIWLSDLRVNPSAGHSPTQR